MHKNRKRQTFELLKMDVVELLKMQSSLPKSTNGDDLLTKFKFNTQGLKTIYQIWAIKHGILLQTSVPPIR
jgi:hypothetical protein